MVEADLETDPVVADVAPFGMVGLSINRYARENGIAYATLRDWAYAFRDLEVDLVVVPQPPSLFHLLFVLSLRWGAGKDMIAKNRERRKKRARAAELLQSLSQVTQKTGLPRRQRKRAAAWLP